MKECSQKAQEVIDLNVIYFAGVLQAQPFTWSGEMSRESVLILAQHAVQGKLTGADTALARWLVFCHTHSDLPLGDTSHTGTGDPQF